MSVRLVVGVNYSSLEGATQKLRTQIAKKFRFRPTNYFAVQRVSDAAFRTSGWTNFFSDKSGRFPTGLLPEITSYLREEGIPFERMDNRPVPLGSELITVKEDFLAPHMTLHDYQVEIVNTALRERTGIINCATGGGKTVIFAAILKALSHLDNFSAVALFRNKILINQTYELFQKVGIQDVGRVSGDYNEPNKITCSTIQSMHKLPNPGKVTALVVDEVQGFTSSLSTRGIREFKATAWRLGFSATPFKVDDPLQNYKVKSWFGMELCEVTASSLTRKNILAESTSHFYPIHLNEELKHYDWASVEEIVFNDMGVNQNIATLVNKLPTGRILILVKRISQGDILSKLIPGSYWVKGEDTVETREYVLNQLRHNMKDKVVAIFSPIGYIGLDVFVHHIVNATGGKDPGQVIQKLGRGLRRASDKKKLDYHDFMYYNNKHLHDHSKSRMKTLKSEGHEVILEEEIQRSE